MAEPELYEYNRLHKLLQDNVENPILQNKCDFITAYIMLFAIASADLPIISRLLDSVLRTKKDFDIIIREILSRYKKAAYHNDTENHYIEIQMVNLNVLVASKNNSALSLSYACLFTRFMNKLYNALHVKFLSSIVITNLKNKTGDELNKLKQLLDVPKDSVLDFTKYNKMIDERYN